VDIKIDPDETGWGKSGTWRCTFSAALTDCFTHSAAQYHDDLLEIAGRDLRGTRGG
jgi:hypothetical protein